MTDRFIDLSESSLAPGASAVRIHYRDAGRGAPLVFLHGGWGYEVYACDAQIGALESTRRIVIPDRTGYGRSGAIADFPDDFHLRAGDETIRVIDALGLERPVLWGHSDGAIIALQLALTEPDRFAGVIVEATHLYRRKPASREFFETIVAGADVIGDRTASALAQDHGEGWRQMIARQAAAWLRIATQAASDEDDFYGGRLVELRVPALVVHGATDPRTEPGELDALHRALPRASYLVQPDGGHSPHSEKGTADEVTGAIEMFLASLT